MHKMKKYLLIRSISILVTGVFASYMLLAAFYTHQHLLPDGTIITHAHPYDKNDSAPLKSHHHKETDLVILHPLKIVACFPGIVFKSVLNLFSVDFFEFESIFHDQLSDTYRSVRAPPDILPFFF